MVPFSILVATVLAATTAVSGLGINRKREGYRTRFQGCPGNLTGSVIMPSSIIPVSQRRPNMSFGPLPEIALFTPNDFASIFTFSIPVQATNKTCSIYFSFPDYQQLGHAEYSFYGPGPHHNESGHFDFRHFTTAVNRTVTYATLPPIAFDLGIKLLQPKNFYYFASMPCPPAGNISGIGTSNDTQLVYYQQNNQRCPLGLFITYQ